MRLTKKRTAILLVMALLAATCSWAATTATSGTNITSGSTLPGGKVAEVTPLYDVFTVSVGAAKKQANLKLYQIDLGNPQFSHRIRIQILNLDDVGKALRNPNAYIHVSVFYPVDEATWNATPEEDRVKYGEVWLVRDTGEHASARLSQVVGDILLRPSVLNMTTLYILADVYIPRGKGQTPDEPQPPAVPSLEFFCEVRV
ncbi:MAG TPA: hypothetical protein G4O03_00875 [Dehalococcoidia bacterium]|jgi:hypothetical protein|nr:hypothetical protein [Dehalococcoidia bacterium]